MGYSLGERMRKEEEIFWRSAPFEDEDDLYKEGRERSDTGDPACRDNGDPSSSDEGTSEISDEDLYAIAVLRYKEEFPDLDEHTFGIDWTMSGDYHRKVIILAEAIRQHVPVEETEMYKEFFGG